MFGLLGAYSLIHILISRANHLLWSVRRGHRGGSDCSFYAVRGELARKYRFSVAGSVNWQQSPSRHFIGGGWPARRSWLRSDGDSRSPVWKAHRAGVYHLFPAGQAGAGAEQAPRLTPCDPGLSNCVVSARDAIGGLAPQTAAISAAVAFLVAVLLRLAAAWFSNAAAGENSNLVRRW